MTLLSLEQYCQAKPGSACRISLEWIPDQQITGDEKVELVFGCRWKCFAH